MIERLREGLGLKRLPRAVSDKIYEADARMGMGLSVLVALLEVVMIANLLVDPEAMVPANYDSDSWVLGHLLSYCFLLAASVLLFVCSLLYLRGTVRNHWFVRISVFLFEVTAFAFGIYISSIDYEQGRMILVFVTMAVACSCLFIVVPVVAFCINTVAFVVFFCIIGEIAGTAPVGINLFSFWLVTLVVSIVRFNEKRSAVQAQFEVTDQSMHDALTGLKNRRSLNEDFERVPEGDVGLVMLDVDDFKFFNDAYGHGVGDAVLVQFAEALLSAFPEEACYRSGGDEFLVMERGADEARLRSRLHGLHFTVREIQVDGEKLLVSSSVGAVTGHVQGAADLQKMLTIVDIAMYEAKRQGKDRVVFKSYDAADSPEEEGGQGPRVLAYKIEETDLLTGLPNYTHFRSRAARALRDSSACERGLALVYFDIANFKAFNYEYGYEGGDAYLQSLANVLREVFKGQLIARFGEDRFVVLADKEGIFERVTDAHERAHGYQRDVSLEVKAGICFPGAGETDVSVLYDRAKLACDSIKTEFDRIYCVYDDELNTQTLRRNHIVNALDTALENGWIQVYYQPVIRTQTCRLCGVEALARWIDPEFGMISPGEFVDVLEQHHLVNKLDVFMLGQICRDYHKLIEAQCPPVPVSLNLSRLDFELCDVFGEVENAVAEYDMPKGMLHLEVTETALADNSELIKDQIARFRVAGYQVWMDDFGSGYSSLNLLKEYEFDVLKIDMLFLRGLQEHEESRVIISSIVDMAKQLGIQTLAEGVETQEQLEFLQEIGCEKLQGYFFSPPRPIQEVLELVESGSMTVELTESHRYYTETGKVNIIGRSPARSKDDDEVNTGVLPLAVLEYRAGEFHYLSANRSYKELMQKLKVGTIEDAENRFNHEFLRPVLTFKEVCQAAKREGGLKSIDHITHGVHCNTRVSYVASDGDSADAFLICTISDADFTTSDEESSLQDALRAVISIYTRVDLIAEDNALMENIYLNSGQYKGAFTRDDVKTSIIDYANNNIHPDDRMRFMEYYDMGSVRQRIIAHSLSHLSAFFRTVAPDAGYVWQFYMLIPMERDGRRLWLSCVRDIDAGSARFLPEAGGITEEAMLWESILGIEDIGIFWKDDKLRFVGANKSFMDFYGLDSARDFVGKTDEGMGWNIFNNRVGEEEGHLIETGEPVRDERVSCLAQGNPHEIIVNKVPILDSGRIVGLVGAFRVVDDEPLESSGFFSLISAINLYIRAYREDGVDFGFTCVRVAEVDDCEKLHETEFADKVARRFEYLARKIVGNGGIVIQLGQLSFAIAMQLRDEEQKKRLNEEFGDVFSKVSSIEGIPCKFEFRAGSATFSETGSLENMVRTAEDRMG